jgi:hypothetical protein
LTKTHPGVSNYQVGVASQGMRGRIYSVHDHADVSDQRNFSGRRSTRTCYCTYQQGNKSFCPDSKTEDSNSLTRNP